MKHSRRSCTILGLLQNGRRERDILKLKPEKQDKANLNLMLSRALVFF